MADICCGGREERAFLKAILEAVGVESIVEGEGGVLSFGCVGEMVLEAFPAVRQEAGIDWVVCAGVGDALG